MNNLVKTISLVFVVISMSLFYSCAPESLEKMEQNLIPQDEAKGLENHDHNHALCDHVKHLDIDLKDAQRIKFEFPDGTFEDRF